MLKKSIAQMNTLEMKLKQTRLKAGFSHQDCFYCYYYYYFTSGKSNQGLPLIKIQLMASGAHITGSAVTVLPGISLVEEVPRHPRLRLTFP